MCESGKAFQTHHPKDKGIFAEKQAYRSTSFGCLKTGQQSYQSLGA